VLVLVLALALALALALVLVQALVLALALALVLGRLWLSGSGRLRGGAVDAASGAADGRCCWRWGAQAR
jgi:hypothetical protein